MHHPAHTFTVYIIVVLLLLNRVWLWSDWVLIGPFSELTFIDFNICVFKHFIRIVLLIRVRVLLFNVANRQRLCFLLMLPQKCVSFLLLRSKCHIKRILLPFFLLFFPQGKCSVVFLKFNYSLLTRDQFLVELAAKVHAGLFFYSQSPPFLKSLLPTYKSLKLLSNLFNWDFICHLEAFFYWFFTSQLACDHFNDDRFFFAFVIGVDPLILLFVPAR